MISDVSIILILMFFAIFFKDIIRLFINFDGSIGKINDFSSDHYVVKTSKFGMDFCINAYSYSKLKYGTTVYIKRIGFNTYIVYMYVTDLKE